MLRYTLNRLLMMIPTLIGVAVLVFFMLRVIPGDIVEVKLRGDGGTVSQETIDYERKRLGLDKPLLYQFGDYMYGLATFNLGISMWTERPVAEEISLRLELSLQVAINGRPMLRYTLNRILLMIPTLIGVAVLVFFMLRVIPGDVVEVKLRGDGGNVSQETIEMERKRLGLDKPIVYQFKDWMVGLATLDLGRSMWTDRPVTEEIAIRLELSLQVAIMASVIAVLIAIPLGTTAALMRGTWVDYAVRIITIGGLSIPSFWFGMLIMITLLTVFNWLPPITFTPIYVDPIANLTQLIWPAMAVGYRYCAVVARMIRSSLLEVLNEDYIRTARAKGVFEKLVISRHALRNALLPAITVIGLEFAFLIGGLVVTEQVFNLNGIGKLFVQSVSRNDFTLIQGMVMLIAVFYVFTNLVIDLLYAVFDPRIRYG